MVGMYKESQTKHHKKSKKSKSKDTHQELASNLKSKYSGLIASYIEKNVTKEQDDNNSLKIAEKIYQLQAQGKNILNMTKDELTNMTKENEAAKNVSKSENSTITANVTSEEK